jgi:hypothetical protein
MDEEQIRPLEKIIDSASTKDIIQRLANLETHVINMVIPLQHLSKFADHNFLNRLNTITSKPLAIDDSELQKTLKGFADLMEKFTKGTWAIDPDKVYDKLGEISGKCIQLMIQNNRLAEKIDELEKEITKQKIFLTISGVKCEQNSGNKFTEEQLKFLSSEIRNAGIKIRLKNILLSYFHTWQNVLDCGKTKLYGMRHFGNKTIKEVEEIFEAFGIEF